MLTIDAALRIAGRADLVKVATAEDYSFTDKNATIRSCVTAVVKEASADIVAKCRAHARFWGVGDEAEAAMAKVASHVDTVPAEYALDVTEGATRIRKYASFDADSAATAATAFVANRAKYPLEWRKAAAAKLLDAASRYDAHLPAYVETALVKSAGMAQASAESAETALVQRLNLTKHAAQTEADRLSLLLTAVMDSDRIRTDTEFMKAAVAALEDYDVAMGLTDRYGTALGLPEDLLDQSHTALAKVASELKVATLVNGVQLDVAGIAKDALAAVDTKLASLDADELCAVLPTLPRPDADLLVRLTR